ncbi:MAG: hypothetical protein M1837_006407 [Sclerophora amabilis]|nr:MAG: hypothetical protein M1837_006407 [Sclerophora amabilis]
MSQRVRHLLESMYNKSYLRMCESWGARKGSVNCFARLREELQLSQLRRKIPSLVVQIWSRHSRVTFYSGSQLQPLKTRQSPNMLFEIEGNLDPDNTEPIQANMESGGISILDSRLCFTIEEGSAIMFGFSAEGENVQAGNIRIEKVPELEEMVNQINAVSESIAMDFVYMNPDR